MKTDSLPGSHPGERWYFPPKPIGGKGEGRYPSHSKSTVPDRQTALKPPSVCQWRVGDEINCFLYQIVKVCHSITAAACVHSASRVVTSTREFDRGLHHQPHALVRRPRPGSLQAYSDSSPVSERPRTTVSVGALHPCIQC